MAFETGKGSVEPVKNVTPEKVEKLNDTSSSKESVRERSKRAREANEANEDVVYSYDNHDSGKWEIPADQKDKIPSIDKSSTYRALGGVDSTSFDEKKITPELIGKMSGWAEKFAQMYIDQKIVTNFETLTSVDTQADILNIIDHIAQAAYSIKQGRFNMEDFNKTMSKYDKSLVYGSKGAFNILLAVHRADETIKGKTTGDVIYDLRLGSKKLSQPLRFSELAKKRIPVQTKIPEVKENDEFKDAIDDMNIRLILLVDGYKNKYGAKIDFVQKKNERGNYVFTMKCDIGSDKTRNFHVRLIKNGEKVNYSLSDVSLRDGLVYDSADKSYDLVKGKMDAFMEINKQNFDATKKAAVEKEDSDFSKDLVAFFDGNYLQNQRSVQINRQVDGNYGGVKVEGASYGISMASDQYFVFVNKESKSVSIKTVSESSLNKFELATLWTGSSLNLSTEEVKMQFAKKLMEVMQKFQKEEGERIKSWRGKNQEKSEEIKKPVEKKEAKGQKVEVIEDKFYVMTGVFDKDRNIAKGERKSKDGKFIYEGEFDSANHFLLRGKSVSHNGNAKYVSIGEFAKGVEEQLVQGRNEYWDNGKLDKVEEGKFDSSGNILEGRITKFDASGKPAEILEGKFSSHGHLSEGRYVGTKSEGKSLEGNFAGADITLDKKEIKEGELMLAKKVAFDYGKDWVPATAKSAYANAEVLLKNK